MLFDKLTCRQIFLTLFVNTVNRYHKQIGSSDEIKGLFAYITASRIYIESERGDSERIDGRSWYAREGPYSKYEGVVNQT